MIFDATDTLTTKTAFALTCAHLLSVGEDSIARAMQETHCPWADCRLILLGEYTELDKLPPGMLTPEEVQEIKTAPIESDWPDDRDLPVLPSEFVEQFYSKKPDWYTHLTKETYVVDERLEREYYRQYRDWTDSDDDPPRTSDQIRFDKFLCRRSATRGPVVEPHIGPTVLANLSKAQYILEDSLVPYADIDHAMLVKICWSSSDDHSIGSDALFEMVRYGSWAGDRIRLTSVGRLPDPRAGRQWKDITAEVNWKPSGGTDVHICSRTKTTIKKGRMRGLLTRMRTILGQTVVPVSRISSKPPSTNPTDPATPAQSLFTTEFFHPLNR